MSLEFIPLTSQLGIPGTSYRLQLGLINEKWASRILKGKDIIDSYVYKEEDAGHAGFPNQNLIVGWVLRTVAIPNINPHQVMKTTQALVKQAVANKEQKSVKAPVSETKGVKLEKVPQQELKRPKTTGWVKEEGVKTAQEQEVEQRAAFKERLKFREEESKAATPSLKTKRELPTIPSKGGAKVAQTSEKPSKFCPFCGKDLDFKFCPYCGKPLPHEH